MSTPGDHTLNSETDEMDVVDQELVGRVPAVLLNGKATKESSKSAPTIEPKKMHSHLKSSAFGYSSDEEDSNEAGDEDFNSPQGSAQVPTKVKQENGMSSLHTPGVTSSIPYSQHPCTSSVHSLPNSIIASNKQRGNQLVQALKDITRFKSNSDFGTDFSADFKQSLQTSVVGIHESKYFTTTH